MTAPNCPECEAGKHPNCSGDSWDDVEDAPGVCPCWDDGHPGAWTPCPWCPERTLTAELLTHITDEHHYGSAARPRGDARPLRDVDAEAADQESDRVDNLNESRLP